MKKLFDSVKKCLLALTIVITCLASVPTVDAKAVVTSNGSIAKGIDVSKYQGQIDWAKVAASGVKFAFIRIGTIKGGMDPYFLYNIQNAQANGIKVGVYIYSYATNVEMAQLEATLVITWLNEFGLQLPVAYDVEDKCHTAMSTGDLFNMINTFCMLIDAAGYYPMVYTYKSFYHGKLGTSPWDKWMAQYNDSLNTSETVAFWQYSSSGSVPGISGRVDMDYQYKDYSNLIINEGFIDHLGSTRFYRNYKMQRGWIDYQGKKYFADAFGNLMKGWYLDTDSRMYFLDLNDGAVRTGPVEISGFTFYFSPENGGAQQMGFIDYGQGMKYFDPFLNGAMSTSWFAYEGKMHYADKNGNQAIGLQVIDGISYYFDADGALFTNGQIELDGVIYVADANGVLSVLPQIDLSLIDPNTGLMLDPTTGNWINPYTGEVVVTKPE